MTNVVKFPKKTGNGAREAMIGALSGPLLKFPQDNAVAVTDYVLLSLYMAGFEIVPVKD